MILSFSFFSSLSSSKPFFPPSWISTPLPDMLVVIITEPFFPALAIISASFSWFFAFRTMWLIFLLSRSFEYCSDLFILDVKIKIGCPFLLHSKTFNKIALFFSFSFLKIWSFQSFLIIFLFVGTVTTCKLYIS